MIAESIRYLFDILKLERFQENVKDHILKHIEKNTPRIKADEKNVKHSTHL